MCIIVDANIASELCGPSVSDDGRPVVTWIEKGGGVLVHGGKLTEELVKNGRVSRWVRTLTQAGRARLIPQDAIEGEMAWLDHQGLCISDDQHIIAVARVSGARILYSSDQDLHADFGNPAIVNEPRGHVYQNAEHRHLLSKDSCRGQGGARQGC